LRHEYSCCTPHPDGEWVIQQARQVARTLAERADPIRFQIWDRDRKFTRQLRERNRST
jgi:hypothetical protein